jgi:hypothetical protein
VNWSDIAQPPERVRRRGRQDRSIRRLPSEFERVDNALRRPAPSAFPRANPPPFSPPPPPPPAAAAAGHSQSMGGGLEQGRGRGGGRKQAPRVPGGRLQLGESILQF